MNQEAAEMEMLENKAKNILGRNKLKVASEKVSI